jgi:deoxycytidylate deaminase
MRHALKAAQFSEVQGRNRVGAAILKGKTLVSLGWNSDKTHPESKTRYHAHHAEFSCLVGTKKMDVSGSTLFVARVTRRGKLGISKPCNECEQVIRASGIRKVFYLDHEGNVAMMRL